MKRKLFSLLLVLVLCMTMCPVVHAAVGDLTMSVILPGNMVVNFSNSKVQCLTTSGSSYYAYFMYAKFPSDASLSSVSVSCTFSGTYLKLNGTVVATSSPQNVTFDLTTLNTVEVGNNNTSRTYCVAAYKDTFEVKMSFEYENARTFSTLTGSTYGNSGMLIPVDSAQKQTAATAVAGMDTMCNSMYPTLTPAEYREFDGITVTPLSYQPDSYSVYGLMSLFQAGRTNFTFSSTPGSSVHQIYSIGTLTPDSTGLYYDEDFNHNYGAGGWMYQVVRNGVTYTPLVGTSSWKLFPGDEVIWRYTCDFGYDIGYPLW